MVGLQDAADTDSQGNPIGITYGDMGANPENGTDQIAAAHPEVAANLAAFAASGRPIPLDQVRAAIGLTGMANAQQTPAPDPRMVSKAQPADPAGGYDSVYGTGYSDQPTIDANPGLKTGPSKPQQKTSLENGHGLSLSQQAALTITAKSAVDSGNTDAMESVAKAVTPSGPSPTFNGDPQNGYTMKVAGKEIWSGSRPEAFTLLAASVNSDFARQFYQDQAKSEMDRRNQGTWKPVKGPDGSMGQINTISGAYQPISGAIDKKPLAAGAITDFMDAADRITKDPNASPDDKQQRLKALADSHAVLQPGYDWHKALGIATTNMQIQQAQANQQKPGILSRFFGQLNQQNTVPGTVVNPSPTVDTGIDISRYGGNDIPGLGTRYSPPIMQSTSPGGGVADNMVSGVINQATQTDPQKISQIQQAKEALRNPNIDKATKDRIIANAQSQNIPLSSLGINQSGI